jgi:hypothetical protein
MALRISSLLRRTCLPTSSSLAVAKAPSNSCFRPLSTNVGPWDHPEAAEPVRQVFISQSTDVFANLALEDWLYKHHDFEHKVRSFHHQLKLEMYPNSIREEMYHNIPVTL